MKSVGIVRKIDNLGRIVLPKELRKTNNMQAGTSIEIYINKGDVILRKYERGCMFCKSLEDIIEYEGQKICNECLKTIKNKTSNFENKVS